MLSFQYTKAGASDVEVERKEKGWVVSNGSIKGGGLLTDTYIVQCWTGRAPNVFVFSDPSQKSQKKKIH